MLTTQQINELALIILDADIDVKNHNEVDEYIGLVLENIAGCECLSDDEFRAIVQQIREVIETL
ncbi:hypothetical protein [Thalassotalea euphylliae]|uniref:Uncharacterized protein n=1 Tax=Thalassotalea euphylliae TaxID=1655234 RepID=A0A3E0UCT2_9GAMM|nr:hypothetical protein [Thalassotalea euphylliae]REL34689.1 hypothetical protein DXX92_04580 [Thalassotalea euphylliae]